MKRQKTLRGMLRVLGISVMGLGLLISNIPMDDLKAATVQINELDDTGVFSSVIDWGDGELVLGVGVKTIVSTPPKDPADRYLGGPSEAYNSWGPLWQSKLKSLVLSPSITDIYAYTISDKKDDPNIYEEYDNIKNIIITVPANIRNIERNAIICYAKGRTITLRSYATQLNGYQTTPNTADSVAKRYVEDYNRGYSGKPGDAEGVMIFEEIPSTITYKTKDSPLNVDITKASATFMRAGYQVNGPLELHVNTMAADLTKIDGIPAVPQGDKRLYYDITLKDNIFGSVVNKQSFPFDSATITLPVPSSVDLTKFKLSKIYTSDSENKLEEIKGMSINTTARTVTFTTSHLSTFAFEYSPIMSRPSSNSIAGASMTVTRDGDYTYHIAQKENSNITENAGVPALVKDGKRFYFDITLTNSSGNPVTDFGTASVKLPLPADVTLDKYKLNQVYTINSAGKYEKISNPIISTDTTVSPNVSYINFSTTHFSEYVVEFAPIEAENAENNNNGDNNNNQNNQNNQNNNNENNTDNAGNGENNNTGTDNNGNNTDNNPDNGGDNTGDNPDNGTDNNNENNTGAGTNNNGNNTGNGTEGNTGNNTNNNNPGNNAGNAPGNNTGGDTGNTGNTGNTGTDANTGTNTGTNTNTNVDMPRTADMTGVQNIIVIMLFALGGIMLLLSFNPEKSRRAIKIK